MLCRKSNNICGSSIRLIVTYRLAPLGPISARLGDIMQQPMTAGRFSCLDARVVQSRHQRENPWHSLSQCYPHKREGQLLLELTDGDYSPWQQQRPGLMTLGLGSYGAPQHQMQYAASLEPGAEIAGEYHLVRLWRSSILDVPGF